MKAIIIYMFCTEYNERKVNFIYVVIHPFSQIFPQHIIIRFNNSDGVHQMHLRYDIRPSTDRPPPRFILNLNYPNLNLTEPNLT